MKINYKIYRGSVDKNLSVTYAYTYTDVGDFQTVTQRDNGSVTIIPSYGINISRGFNQEHIYITSNQYYVFTSLLLKTVKMISDHLYEIFPNVGKVEFEIDTKTLERFQIEKAIAADGITMIPTVWVDETNQCFPGIQINTLKLGTIKIPLQDAIPMSLMFKSFDPLATSLTMLRICGKID